jgi:hypothetical protein
VTAWRFVAVTSVGLVVLVAGTARADDDPPNVCIELHCYCDGPDEPDTVGPCETTCDELCAGRSTGGGRPWVTQRISVGAYGGGGSSVDDGTGSSSSGDFTTGGDVRLIMGARPLFAIEISAGAMVTALSDQSGGQKVAWVPLMVGLSSSPKIIRGKHRELRLDLGADVGALFGLQCEGCTVKSFGAQLRAGLDVYLGSTRTGGFAVDVVYTPSAVAKLADPSTVEIRPPPVLLRVAFIWRRSALLW